MRSLAIGFLLLAATGALAQQPYEHVIAGYSLLGGCPDIVTLPIERRVLEWTGANASYGDSDVLLVAPAPGGRVFAVIGGSGGGFSVAEIRPDGSRTPLIAPVTPPRTPFALVVDRNGAVYVLTTFDHTQDAILAFNPDGTLRATFPLGARYGFGWSATIDLAADQCTLFLVRNSVVRRFNVCTGTALPDFVTAPMGAYAVRVLPDGGILVSLRDEILQYDPSGALVRSYPTNGEAHVLMLRDGGSRLVYNDRGEEVCGIGLATLDLRNGTVVTSPLNVHRPLSIVPYHAWTAALGSHHGATDLPVTGAVGLAILAALSLVVAVFRLR